MDPNAPKGDSITVPKSLASNDVEAKKGDFENASSAKVVGIGFVSLGAITLLAGVGGIAITLFAGVGVAPAITLLDGVTGIWPAITLLAGVGGSWPAITLLAGVGVTPAITLLAGVTGRAPAITLLAGVGGSWPCMILFAGVRGIGFGEPKLSPPKPNPSPPPNVSRAVAKGVALANGSVASPNESLEKKLSPDDLPNPGDEDPSVVAEPNESCVMLPNPNPSFDD